MRLSDAIALGRVTVRRMAAHRIDGCALGMAAGAIGLEVNSTTQAALKLPEVWPWMQELTSPHCPKCKGCSDKPSFFTSIFLFFDKHVMELQDRTLDQLIDWVRSIEPPEPEFAPEAREAGLSPIDTNSLPREVLR